ncbi:peptide ABC transporter ATPase (plasmid) [Aminobacter sp. Y103A]|uniref:ABC transporter ATP-binding protein n=1 Tax=Aminobacter sp. Y103A TaxID=1870862 RepID=UPI00257438A4|nr:oligopeptide/dipeptide ABC transporter ATP-binding protein [Aminobacter sp. SS-2016]BBD41265.1 peptide ABC transporter ATPase [Aminobacter sp. SS-2016]
MRTGLISDDVDGANPTAANPLLRVQGLRKYFPIQFGLLGRPSAYVRSVDGVSFDVAAGETLGIVGESGCGKSTTARVLIRLLKPDEGAMALDGQPVGAGGLSEREMRQQIQMVFQDSYASLNPRLTIEDSIAFGLRANGVKRALAQERAHEVLDMVGLRPAVFAQRYPHELSGGQRQRVNIARALALNPRIVILDEAVSALDKSVEAQVLNLLVELKERLNLTYIFISHDLNVVQYISDRVMVMYLGQAIEMGPVSQIYGDPKHPYTRGLLASRLPMDPRHRVSEPPLAGDPPNPINPPSGCRFRTRCPIAETVCAATQPMLLSGGRDHQVACHAHQPGSGHSLATAAA